MWWTSGSQSKHVTRHSPQTATWTLTLCDQEEWHDSTTGFHRPVSSSLPFCLHSDPDRSQLLLSRSFLNLPVPYTDLVLNHQLSTFLQIFPSHFTNCFAKGSRNHWFQSFLLLGLGSKRPALPWNVGVLPLKVYNYQVSVMYERQNRLLTKVTILYMIVWKGGLQKSFWHPVFMLDKTWSNSLSSQPIFNGNSQEEIFYTKTCMYMCNRQKFCLWPTKNWFYDQLMSHNIWSKKCF